MTEEVFKEFVSISQQLLKDALHTSTLKYNDGLTDEAWIALKDYVIQTTTTMALLLDLLEGDD